MHFGENQLSRSLIGLSPLPTTHPPGFQPWWVRASTTSYSRFTLAMGRSPRFGSTPRDSTINQDGNALFGLAFATAPPHRVNLATKHTRFQVLFHSPPGVLFIIPSRYYPLSVTREYLGLPGGPGRFTANSTSSLLLGETVHDTRSVFAYGALTHYGDPFQKSSTNTTHMPSQIRQNPHDDTPQHRIRNPCRVSHEHGLASSAFARHYSRNHGCFLFQWVLRCFTSPRSPQHPMNSDAGNAP
jgi:hypothetical protein